MKRFLNLSVTFLLATLFAAAAFPQATPVGAIRGTVTDASGGPLPGATVEITSEERGVVRTEVTDTNGEFHLALLPVGAYRVVISLSGFDTVTREHNLVEAQKTTRVDAKLQLGAITAEITVSGEVPIVDRTSPASETRFRKEELETLPMGRGYQTVMTNAPGVMMTSGDRDGFSGNPVVHGALTSNNQYQFDGMDVTDGTTGTFGANLNYEAVQEVTVYTSGISAEYGRAAGGLVNVVTKSGSNTPEGSFKYIATNDEWNEQNTTVNQVTGASLARNKLDKISDRMSATLGGPILRDRVWFFGAWEEAITASSPFITPVTEEEDVMNRTATYDNYRLTGQITPKHNIWAKYSSDPDTGILRDYWATAAGAPNFAVVAGELEALTAQTQGGENWGVNWNGVISPRLAVEALYSKLDNTITVGTYNSESSIENGAVHVDLSTGFYFNGPTFIGFVQRPRESVLLAGSYFTAIGGNNHDIKVGADWQSLESSSQFGYPANRYYEDDSFDPVTRTFVPHFRYDFDEPQPSISKGDITSFFARDKFEIGNRLFMEAGLRFDQQDGSSDVGVTTFESSTISPRLSASFDLAGNGKTLVVGTAGRFYQFLIQSYTDAFANVPQQGAYSIFSWNGSEFVQTGRQDPSSNDLSPNPDLDPTYMDEVTIGFEQQIGNTVGIGIRGVFREWNDMIDDRLFFDAEGNIQQDYVNYEPAKRDYMGVELVFDKRFSNNWSANVNYTYSQAEGNHFASFASTLGDYVSATCQTSVDTTIGNNGVIPCAEVQDGANKLGLATYDRPHYVKALTNYSVPVGRANVTLGLAGNWRSGLNYTPTRTVNVLNPAGQPVATAVYFYTDRGADRLDSVWEVDTALEATWRLWRNLEIGFKGEVFNVTDQQEQVAVNNAVFCGDANAAPTSACGLARARYGTATTRASFQTPRQYRLTGLVRF